MSASESKDFSNRLPLINQQRPALFTNSPFRSPPPPRSSSRMSDQWVAPSEINLPSPNLRTPSSIMQIPERQPQPPLRDSFPFTSPSHHISNTEHSPYSPHNAPAGPKHTMTRHGSFPSQHPLSTSPTDPNRPRPPPLRTAHSAYTPRTAVQPFSPREDDGDMQDSKGTEDAGDGDELTTKGRKRKRLAKACSACHKNKRRCDGFAPCSNCEFSSRPCLYLNSMGETIPPPRTRDSFGLQGGSGSSTPGVLGKGKAGGNPMSQSGSAQGTQGQDRMPGQDSEQRRGGMIEDGRKEGSSRRISVVTPVERRKTAAEVVDMDPILSAELIDIFFRVSAPFSAMLHPATFHHRLYLSKTSPILLDAIYAFAARSSTSPSLLSCYPPIHPPWLRGDHFAERAHIEAERTVTRIKAGTGSESRPEQGSWEELEEIQAFTLLSIHFACLRQPSLALFYLDLAMSKLRPTSQTPPRARTDLSAVELATLEESRSRTFWLIALHDLCAATDGRTRILADREMEGVPLPGVESLWVRYGGARMRAEDDQGGRHRDGLVLGSGDWIGEAGQVGELGHILRILSIFSNIMAVANGSGSGPDIRSAPLHQHQDALKSWAQNLPPHLRFDERNLSNSVAQLQSPLPHIAFSGWAFGYMHAIAECGMFYLQAAVAQQPGASWTAQRQGQAVDNIAVVLDALGERGRESPLMIFPISVVSNWQDHIRKVNPTPTPQQLQLDDRLNLWWAEAKHQWGAERGQALIHEHPLGARPVYPEVYRRNTLIRDPRAYEEGPAQWSSNSGRYADRSKDERYPAVDSEYHRGAQLNKIPRYDYQHHPSESHRFGHSVVDAPLVPFLPTSQNINGNSAYERYASSGTSPRDIMSNTAMRHSVAGGSSDVYPTNPYPRSGRYADPHAHQSQSAYYLSPPDLANSASTSSSQLLPTPYSTGPSLPPLPQYGARPRATSSVIPYSSRPSSPGSSSAFGGGLGAERRHPGRLSVSQIDVGRKEGRDSAGKGCYLPPSAELRHLRQLDEIPRGGGGSSSALGLGLGLAKTWDQRSLPSISLDKGAGVRTSERGIETAGGKQPARSQQDAWSATAGSEPFGIAALISAAESEREKVEDERRESEGSAAGMPSGIGKEEAQADGEDVKMGEEASGADASIAQPAVVA